MDKQTVISEAINWNAVSAISNFLVVLVALFPLFLKFKRDREARKNLRNQLRIRLYNIRHLLRSRIMSTWPHDLHTDGVRRTLVYINSPLTTEEQTALASLDQLFAQSHILRNSQHRWLCHVTIQLSNFKLFAMGRQLETDDIRTLLKVVDDGLYALGYRKEKPDEPDNFELIDETLRDYKKAGTPYGLTEAGLTRWWNENKL